MQIVIHWTDKPLTTHKYKDHTPYLKQNDPPSSYPLHILNNKHEYGTINDTTTPLKIIITPTLL